MMWLPILGGLLATIQADRGTELTVYNQGFALVKELRDLDLKMGRQTIAIEDVAAQIEPNSVGFRSVSAPGSLSVLEQNYQYDLIGVEAILNKAVGKKIVFNRVNPDGKKERIVGTLLSSPTAIVNAGPDLGNPFQGYYGGGFGSGRNTYNGMVVKADDGRILLNPTGEIEVAEIPEGLISRPTLMWELDSRRAGKNSVELSYLTNGITWNSDYVMTISDDGSGSFVGWVTLSNQCGRSFKAVNLKLLAGDVNRVRPQPRGMAGGFGGGGMAMDMARAKNFEEESLFEYHLYTLQRPATVRDRETKQISLLESDTIKYQKRLILDPLRMVGTYYPGEGEVGVGELKPQVRVEFVNDKASGLGVPLPQGRVKVYQRDKAGAVQMIGEDQINHTPKDEKVSLVVGRSFDIVGERVRTNFERLGVRRTRESFQIEIRNRKDVADTVYYLERRWGDWTVTAKSMDFRKADSNTMEFTVNLAPGEKKQITFTVETVW